MILGDGDCTLGVAGVRLFPGPSLGLDCAASQSFDSLIMQGNRFSNGILLQAYPIPNLDQNAPAQSGIVGTYNVTDTWVICSLANEYHVGDEPREP